MPTLHAPPKVDLMQIYEKKNDAKGECVQHEANLLSFTWTWFWPWINVLISVLIKHYYAPNICGLYIPCISALLFPIAPVINFNPTSPPPPSKKKRGGKKRERLMNETCHLHRLKKYAIIEAGSMMNEVI